MQFTQILSLLSLAAASQAITVAYDTGYDDGSRSLTAVACSDGANGLITRKGWQTQGAIPKFPYIGAAEAVSGYNSPNCGTCWALSYNGKTINILAIDHAAAGFNIALDAMNDLTNGQAVAVGRVEATAVQVDASVCGM
ncbi:eliciting plant response-like protein [Pseudomassariella vexata]|uniref:Eliciting plant response-like protein n=1 Tax=Pseudomassariella vexata TaxID=1141098 RepID=A0A1Y2E788_9PEZI|nr:eliciting plant response-like protein [Pseudomassariella vexata]ORY67399.1 eliciting plant response-like protein [Pseudomassariella vexata]